MIFLPEPTAQNLGPQLPPEPPDMFVPHEEAKELHMDILFFMSSEEQLGHLTLPAFEVCSTAKEILH